MDYRQEAFELLAPHRGDPVARARRIYSVYAGFWLSDPLLYDWCGLAAFVGKKVWRVLELGIAGEFGGFVAKGNMLIYESIVPELLAFRQGDMRQSPLSPAFALLREADEIARTDLRSAVALARRASRHIAEVEQRRVVQPIYDQLPDAASVVMRPHFGFRLGNDSAARVMRFEGTNPASADERVDWCDQSLLPAWNAETDAAPERMRADLTRLWREGA